MGDRIIQPGDSELDAASYRGHREGSQSSSAGVPLTGAALGGQHSCGRWGEKSGSRPWDLSTLGPPFSKSSRPPEASAGSAGREEQFVLRRATSGGPAEVTQVPTVLQHGRGVCGGGGRAAVGGCTEPGLLWPCGPTREACLLCLIVSP